MTQRGFVRSGRTTAFTGLRWGEVIALRRKHLDLDGEGVVMVGLGVRDRRQVRGGAPMSAAGRRVVAIPAAVVPELWAHLDTWSEPGPEGRVFVGPKGGIPRRTNFQATWDRAIEKVGVPGVHVHDLRHTGNIRLRAPASRS